MRILKFGGSSVQDTAAIQNLISIVHRRTDKKQIVVVSALARITNQCLELLTLSQMTHEKNTIRKIIVEIKERHLSIAQDFQLDDTVQDEIHRLCNELFSVIQALHYLGEISDRSRDKVVSYGELLSSFLIASIFTHLDATPHFIDSRSCLITDTNHTQAEILNEQTNEAIQQNMLSKFNSTNLLVCGGFIASTAEGVTSTLGRGGSDYSAAIIAAAVQADSIEIWTDVDGIMTCDPRWIATAKSIRQLSFTEAAELAYFGAKVLHPKTILPAIKKNIPVWVLNSKNPEASGTVILSQSNESGRIKALSFRQSITVLTIYSNRMLGAVGFLAKVFSIFESHRCSIDLISTSEVNISLTIEETSRLSDIVKELSQFSSVTILKNHAILSMVGDGLRQQSGIAAEIFSAIRNINVVMISQGASDVNVSIVLHESELKTAIEQLHHRFLE